MGAFLLLYVHGVGMGASPGGGGVSDGEVVKAFRRPLVTVGLREVVSKSERRQIVTRTEQK